MQLKPTFSSDYPSDFLQFFKNTDTLLRQEASLSPEAYVVSVWFSPQSVNEAGKKTLQESNISSRLWKLPICVTVWEVA